MNVYLQSVIMQGVRRIESEGQEERKHVRT